MAEPCADKRPAIAPTVSKGEAQIDGAAAEVRYRSRQGRWYDDRQRSSRGRVHVRAKDVQEDGYEQHAASNADKSANDARGESCCDADDDLLHVDPLLS